MPLLDPVRNRILDSLGVQRIGHARVDTISGKFIHGDDIQNNEKSSRAKLASPEMKERKKKYMEFIQPTKPEA